jgi:uncharacterized protein (DUF2267 family)
VPERDGADKPAAVHHAQVVIEILQDAVSTGERDDLQAQLPDTGDTLFEQGAAGTLDTS